MTSEKILKDQNRELEERETAHDWFEQRAYSVFHRIVPQRHSRLSPLKEQLIQLSFDPELLERRRKILEQWGRLTP